MPDLQAQLQSSKSFTPDITPLVLASHKDNYEIIKILLDRGAQIPEPVSFFFETKLEKKIIKKSAFIIEARREM